MRTIQIGPTVSAFVPEGAKFYTVSADGIVTFWRNRPEIWQGYDMELECEDEEWSGGIDDYISHIETFLDCPTWRDSLVELEPETTER